MRSSALHAEELAMDTAEAWVARLASPDLSERDRAEFEAWCSGSSAHLQDFVEADRLNERVRDLASDPLIAAAARAARRKPAAQPLRWLALAASLAAAAVLGFWQWNAATVQRYDTRIGEQREIRFDDGTRAMLDTDSAVSLTLGARRELTLERGRVELDIAPADKPFVAYAANGTIRDIGTRFQLARRGDRVDVVLLEGEVSIESTGSSAAPTVLKPGMQARLDRSGAISAGVADVEAAQGWTRGELVFKHRPLGELVAEMNRYSTTQLRLGQDDLDTVAVSGLFHAGDQEALIKALESGWSLRAERVSATEVVLHSAQRR